jgi:hypothetical protein
MNEEKQKFEAWRKSLPSFSDGDLTKVHDGGVYVIHYMRESWATWQAAKASIETNVWLPLSEAPKDGRLVECKWFEFDGEEKRFFLYWNHVYKEWGSQSLDDDGIFNRFKHSDLSHVQYREVTE